MKIAKKIAIVLFDCAIIFPWVWLFASWVNVILNNRDPGGVFAAWNLFEIFF
jgi:hypothetical protein